MLAGQAYTTLASSDNPSIVRPKVLLVIPHPTIGAALQTILGLEGRYDVRRVSRLADGVALAEGWPADVAIVDGALLAGGSAAIGIPALVLAGTPEQGASLAKRLDRGRGWLPKDVAPDALVRAIDDAVGTVRIEGDVRSTAGLLSAVIIAIAAVSIALLVIYRLVLPV